MACPSKNSINMLPENHWLIEWCENFYISIIEANFLSDLSKYTRVFELISILNDMAKINVIQEREKYIEKLFILENKWRGNELSISKLEYELKRKIFELKEEKINYKIILLLLEIRIKIENQKLSHLKDDFYTFKKMIIEKLQLNTLSRLEKKIIIKKIEKFHEILSMKNKKIKKLFNFIDQ